MELITTKERVLIHQLVAKDNEKSLTEMTSSYESYKEAIMKDLK
jgi:hypothetical protein